jgi:hypothetical protein
MSDVAGGGPVVRPEDDMTRWGPDYLEDPYPFYAARRDEAPACPVLTEGLPAWLLTPL